MKQPLQITMRDIEHSDAVEAHITEKADKLNQYFDDIIACHVSIEQVQKHQHTGKLYNVRIVLEVPNKELAANHNANENLYIAIRDSFTNIRDQLKSYCEQLRHHTKADPGLLHGEIIRIFDEEGFGFIAGDDGTEYYFNANNVVANHFNQLDIGHPVQFIEYMGDEGPQAHKVKPKKQAE